MFYPSIDTDPVDIMELEAGKQYTITPKSSKLYFIMLDKLFSQYCSTGYSKLGSSISFPLNQIQYRAVFIGFIANEISWWFRRLLRLSDNDLKVYVGFDFSEVLYICDKLHNLFDQSPEDISRFKELLPKVREYVAARLLSFK